MPPPSRQWGTRYDAIHDLGSSISTTSGSAQDDSFSSDPKSNSQSFQSTDSHPHSDDPPRVLADTQEQAHSSDSPAYTGFSQYYRPRPLHRWNHNASVFVASLAPLPESEILELLRDAFTAFGKVLNIKFIHDVKAGGAATCAFIQFETPEQALAAIQNRHMSLLAGRIIRCEPARAHRTLLVSFIPPSFSFYTNTSKAEVPRTTKSTSSDEHNWVRLRRPDPQSRYIQVTFGEEAKNYEDEWPSRPPYSEDRLQGAGAVIDMAESPDTPRFSTLKLITELIGPLEMIRPFFIPSSTEVAEHPYAPHPPSIGFRPDDDDGLTWEVKWEQRNDAITAFHTLGQFPSFIVTWAHEHPHPQWTRPNRHAYPSQQQYGPPSALRLRTPSPLPPRHLNQAQSHSTRDALPASSQVSETQLTKGTPSPSYSKIVASISASSSKFSTGSSTTAVDSPLVQRITEVEDEFPPLAVSSIKLDTPKGNKGSSHAVITPTTNDSIVTAVATEGEPETKSKKPKAFKKSDTLTSATPAGKEKPIERSSDESKKNETTDPSTFFTLAPHAVVGRSSILLKLGASQPGKPSLPVLQTFLPPDKRSPLPSPSSATTTTSLLSPETPALLRSSSVPDTPSTIAPTTPSSSFHLQAQFKMNEHHDSTEEESVFVSGLDRQSGWNEDILRTIFGQYGPIRSVRIVFKGYHGAYGRYSSGYAFLTFENAESVKKAIAVEHGKIHRGHSISVAHYQNRPGRSRLIDSGSGGGLGLEGTVSFNDSKDEPDVDVSAPTAPFDEPATLPPAKSFAEEFSPSAATDSNVDAVSATDVDDDTSISLVVEAPSSPSPSSIIISSANDDAGPAIRNLTPSKSEPVHLRHEIVKSSAGSSVKTVEPADEYPSQPESPPPVRQPTLRNNPTEINTPSKPPAFSTPRRSRAKSDPATPAASTFTVVSDAPSQPPPIPIEFSHSNPPEHRHMPSAPDMYAYLPAGMVYAAPPGYMMTMPAMGGPGHLSAAGPNPHDAGASPPYPPPGWRGMYTPINYYPPGPYIHYGGMPAIPVPYPTTLIPTPTMLPPPIIDKVNMPPSERSAPPTPSEAGTPVTPFMVPHPHPSWPGYPQAMAAPPYMYPTPEPAVMGMPSAEWSSLPPSRALGPGYALLSQQQQHIPQGTYPNHLESVSMMPPQQPSHSQQAFQPQSSHSPVSHPHPHHHKHRHHQQKQSSRNTLLSHPSNPSFDSPGSHSSPSMHSYAEHTGNSKRSSPSAPRSHYVKHGSVPNVPISQPPAAPLIGMYPPPGVMPGNSAALAYDSVMAQHHIQNRMNSTTQAQWGGLPAAYDM